MFPPLGYARLATRLLGDCLLILKMGPMSSGIRVAALVHVKPETVVAWPTRLPAVVGPERADALGDLPCRPISARPKSSSTRSTSRHPNCFNRSSHRILQPLALSSLDNME